MEETEMQNIWRIAQDLSCTHTKNRAHNEQKTTTISSNSYFYLLWCCASALFVCYDVFCLTISFIEPVVTSMVVEWIMHCFWHLDICLAFVVSVHIEYTLVTDHYRIALHYMKTWFVFDTLVVILQWMDLLNMFSGEGGTLNIKILKALRYMRMVRFFKMRRLFDKVMETLNSTNVQVLIKLSCFLLGLMAWVHVTGCVYYFIGRSGWVQNRDLHVESFLKKYVQSLNWSLSQLQGSTDVVGCCAHELAYGILVVFISIVLLALFVGNLTKIMLEFSESNDKRHARLEATVYFLHRHNVSSDLSIAVKRHLKQSLSTFDDDPDDDNLLSFLPVTLRRALLCEVRQPFLQRHVVFRSLDMAHAICYEHVCCDAMRPQFHSPDSIIFTTGERCYGMVFVTGGALQYRKCHKPGAAALGIFDFEEKSINVADLTVPDQSNRTLPGNFLIQSAEALCEPVLWCHWQHNGDLRTTHLTSLLILKAGLFCDFIGRYPRLIEWGSAHASKFLEVLNDDAAHHVSDLFNSDDLGS